MQHTIICTHVYYVHTYVHCHLYMYTYVHTYVYVEHLCKYICTYVYACAHVSVRTYIHTCTAYSCIKRCMYIHTYIQSTYVHMYIVTETKFLVMTISKIYIVHLTIPVRADHFVITHRNKVSGILQSIPATPTTCMTRLPSLTWTERHCWSPCDPGRGRNRPQ